MKRLLSADAENAPLGQYTGVRLFWLTEKLKKTDRKNRFM